MQHILGQKMENSSKLLDGLLARQEGLPCWLDGPRLQEVEAVLGRVATSEARFSFVDGPVGLWHRPES